MSETNPHKNIPTETCVSNSPFKTHACDVDILRYRGEVLDAFSILESRWSQLEQKYGLSQKLSSPFGCRVEQLKTKMVSHKDEKKISCLIERLLPIVQRRANIVHSKSSIAYCEKGTALFIFRHVPVHSGIATIMNAEELAMFLRKIRETSHQISQLLLATGPAHRGVSTATASAN